MHKKIGKIFIENKTNHKIRELFASNPANRYLTHRETQSIFFSLFKGNFWDKVESYLPKEEFKKMDSIIQFNNIHIILLPFNSLLVIFKVFWFLVVVLIVA